MHNQNPSRSASPAFAGIDVSKDHLDACLERAGAQPRTGRFANDQDGHEKLLRWLCAEAQFVRVCLEASGLYSLDLALSLDAASTTEVMVANPRAVSRFRDALLERSKTDSSDAAVICAFARRMPFKAWTPPERAVLDLRAIARRIQALTAERTRAKNRLHAAEQSRTCSAVVVNDIEVNVRHLKRRIAELTRQALKVAAGSEKLETALSHLTSIKGVAQKSALLILAEVALLSEDMTVREWVAYAGLDPRRHQSGNSVDRPERISKVGNARLRRSLYMPALVAIRWEPNVGAFYEKLTRRGKKPIVAVVAVMRKLLHAIYGMLKHDADFDGAKFYRLPEKVPAAP